MKEFKSKSLQLRKKRNKRNVVLSLENSQVRLNHILKYEDLVSLKQLINKKIEDISPNHFKINDYLTLKLEKKETNIYVAGKKFKQCKYLFLNLDMNNVRDYDNITSIDDAEEKLKTIDQLEPDLDASLHGGGSFIKEEYGLNPYQEFVGHCSNLQAWYEHDYDTRLLHRNLAFPLLSELYKVGDPLANRVFKEQLINRLKLNEPNVTYTIIDKYLKNFSKEELEVVLFDLDSLFTKLLVTFKCIKENHYGISPKKVKYHSHSSEPSHLYLFDLQFNIYRKKDIDLVIKERSDYQEKYLFEKKELVVNSPNKRAIIFQKNENLNFDTPLFPKMGLELIEKIFEDPTAIKVLSPNNDEKDHLLFFYSEEEDILIEGKMGRAEAIIQENNNWTDEDDEYKNVAKEVFSDFPNYVRLAVQFKLLGYAIDILDKYTFRVINVLTIRKYNHSKTPDDLETMPYKEFKKRAKPRLNKTLIDFGIKGVRTRPKDKINPEDVVNFLYKYKDIQLALKCFKDKDSMQVRFSNKLKWVIFSPLNFRSKKEDLDVLVRVYKTI
jgi:hypothetical protein